MKKTLVVIIMFLCLLWCMNLNLLANKKKSINNPPFDRLVFHKPLYLEFKYPYKKNVNYLVSFISKDQSVKNKKEILILQTKPIKEIFKQVKLRQTVTIELGFIIGNFEKRVKIGTFEPILREGHRKILVKYIILEFIPILFSENFKRNFLTFQLAHDLPIDECKNCYLVFKNDINVVMARFNVVCRLPFKYEFEEFEEIIRLIVKEKFIEAELFCKRQKGEIQIRCFRILGDTFFVRKEYKKAAQYYEKGKYKKGINEMGAVYFEVGNYKEAIIYFERGTHSSLRAEAYALVADEYKKNDKPMLAKAYYKKAVAEYEYLIKDYYSKWIIEDNTNRRRCYTQLMQFPKTEEEKAQHKKLSRILNKVSIYCQKLMKEYFYYFCNEIVREYRNPQKISKELRAIKNKYIYDYQLIKKDKEIREKRILLSVKNKNTLHFQSPRSRIFSKKNKLKMNKKNAELKTYFRYKKLLLGPIAFFSKHWQNYFYYKILKEESPSEKNTTIIEIIPKYFQTANSLIGKIWLQEEDKHIYILKIEWNPKTIVGNFDYLLDLEKIYKSKLFMSLFVEFAIKRQGIRLPSKYYCEVSYINQKTNKKHLHSITEVTFTNHKFFFVETGVKEIGVESLDKMMQ